MSIGPRPEQPVLALLPDNEWLEHDDHGRMLRGGKLDHLELETIAVIRRDEDRLLFQTFAVTSTVRNIKFISGYGPGCKCKRQQSQIRPEDGKFSFHGDVGHHDNTM